VRDLRARQRPVFHARGSAACKVRAACTHTNRAGVQLTVRMHHDISMEQWSRCRRMKACSRLGKAQLHVEAHRWGCEHRHASAGSTPPAPRAGPPAYPEPRPMLSNINAPCAGRMKLQRQGYGPCNSQHKQGGAPAKKRSHSLLPATRAQCVQMDSHSQFRDTPRSPAPAWTA